MNDHYTYRIAWSAEDADHVGLCAEFPSLSWLAPTPATALSGIQHLVRECLADMHTTGEAVPAPIADRYYSGIAPRLRQTKGERNDPIQGLS